MRFTRAATRSNPPATTATRRENKCNCSTCTRARAALASRSSVRTSMAGCSSTSRFAPGADTVARSGALRSSTCSTWIPRRLALHHDIAGFRTQQAARGLPRGMAPARDLHQDGLLQHAAHPRRHETRGILVGRRGFARMLRRRARGAGAGGPDAPRPRSRAHRSQQGFLATEVRQGACRQCGRAHRRAMPGGRRRRAWPSRSGGTLHAKRVTTVEKSAVGFMRGSCRRCSVAQRPPGLEHVPDAGPRPFRAQQGERRFALECE